MSEPNQEKGTYPVAFSLSPADATVSDLVRVPGYELLGELGRGGLGVVYRARQIKADRVVALKMILMGGHAGAAERARFQTEAEAIARLQHAYIVQVFDVGEHQGLPYFSLELCAGGSLEKKLSGTPLPPAEAAALVEKLARGMAAAHDKGVIHRDLKPANVLLTADGAPRITDFGLAKKLDDAAGQTQSGAIMGTPSYMAPEQAGGKSKELGPAADIYALGAILYEMLTGRPPFKAATVMDTLLQVIHDEPVPPSQLQSKTPRDLETICLKCLQKDAGKRYDSAASLADDLLRYHRGEPITARPVGRLERGWRWCKRNPALAAVTGVAASALLAVTVVSALFGAQQAADARSLRAQKEELAESQLQLQATDRQRAEALENAARLSLGRGIALAEQGETAQALLWMARGLEIAPAENADLQRLIRLNLGGWRDHLGDLKAILPTRRGVRATSRNWLAASAAHSDVLSSDGTRLATIAGPHSAQIWDAATGQRMGEPLTHRDIELAFCVPGRRTVITVARIEGSPTNVSSVRLWDGDACKPLTEELLVKSWLPSSDGSKIAIAGKPAVENAPFAVHVRATATGQQLGSSLPVANFTRLHFSRDGKWLLIDTGTGIQCVDADTGNSAWNREETREFRYPSPDGKTLLLFKGDTFRLWDGPASRPIGEPFDQRDRHVGVTFSPDGKVVLTQFSEILRLWDATTGKAIGEPLHRGKVADHPSAAFSPDGKTIVLTGKDRSVRLWDAATGKPLGEALPHTLDQVSAAFSRDSKTLMTKSKVRDRTELHLWDADTRRLRVGPLVHPGDVTIAALAPDGSTLLTTTPRTLYLWDVKSGELLGPPLPSDESISNVRWFPDGSQFLVQSHAGDVRTHHADGSVRIWGVPRDRQRIGAAMVHAPAVSHAAFADDGKVVAVSTGNGEYRHDSVTGKMLSKKEFPFDNPSRRWHYPGHDNVRLAFRDPATKKEHEIEVHDAATDRLVGPAIRTHDARGSVLELNRDATMLLSVAWRPGVDDMLRSGREARLWDTASGHPRGSPLVHAFPVRSAAFSPDNRHVLTGSGDYSPWDLSRQANRDPKGDFRLWDAATGQPIGTPIPSAEQVIAVGFHRDGSTFFTLAGNRATNTTWKREVRLWHTATLQPIGEPLHFDGTASSSQALYSPDGKVLAVAGPRNAVTEVWLLDTATARPLRAPLALVSSVNSLAFTPDSRILLTGGGDNPGRKKSGEARLWDVATGRPLGKPITLQAEDVTRVTFSPDGRSFLTTIGATCQLWRTPPLVEGSVEHVTRWTQVLTGVVLDADGVLHPLDPFTWRERLQRLAELGGPP